MVDGWFFSTQENVESNVCINSYKQRKCIKELSALGVLEMEVRGMPATRYFRLNEQRLSCLILNNKICKNEQQVVENLNTNNTKDNNTKKNSTDNSTKVKRVAEPHVDAEEQMIAERGFSDRLESAVREWLQYKKEKKQPYKETGLSNLLKRIQTQAMSYGDDAVIDLIRDSMTNNWQGIVWDISQRKGKASPHETESRIAWIDDWGNT